MKSCSICILNDGIKGVKINDLGVCNFCDWDRKMNVLYPICDHKYVKMLDEIKTNGKDSRYDAVIGISGGLDSSYLLKQMVDNGVRCLAVHWDNNWNTSIARDNIFNITDNLGVDLRIRHINPGVMNNLNKSFLLASVPDADIPNDIALATVLYEEAEREDIGFIINGHSFRTEGTCPNGWTYMDGKYIESVNDAFLKTDLSSFPNMNLKRWLNWLCIRRVRPLYHLDYRKPSAKDELKDIGWVDYGGHHAENLYTKFVGGYLWKYKFNQDLRWVSFSAMVRNGHIDRDLAFREIREPSICQEDEEFLVGLVKKRLGFTSDEFNNMMSFPVKCHLEYETYDFSRLKQLFVEFKDFLPKTFIDKYVEGVV